MHARRYVDRIKSKTVSAPNFGKTVELKLATVTLVLSICALLVQFLIIHVFAAR